MTTEELRDKTTLRQRYLSMADRDIDKAFVLFAATLMEGDPSSFKQGYTLENAVLAANHVFCLPVGDLRMLRERLELAHRHAAAVPAIEFSLDAGESFRTTIDRLRGFFAQVETRFGERLTAEIIGADYSSDHFDSVLIIQRSQAAGAAGTLRQTGSQRSLRVTKVMVL